LRSNVHSSRLLAALPSERPRVRAQYKGKGRVHYSRHAFINQSIDSMVWL
jgi:hypothetical protein